ncbi:MAG: ribose 1,5-bisphosphate isomerase [Candidatus Fermentimicrarchaeum limneticum]|uniref:Ribose 1,5-bisphosphate isomerase n=1 Tax=Fermentimicrarchaeum limneticum TaxID=2795018 RepID=A0A7D6BNM9_FERL1|nr:MAG: ribose 1,5-bisphosphate isomerase [Candidatus Fermentimicrarchaeum limneticum]
MQREVEKIRKDIKRLRIQGARNVAKEAVRAMGIIARKSKAKSREELVNELLVAADELASARPTEPMLRNALRALFAEVRNSTGGVEELRKLVEREEMEYFKRMRENEERMEEYGARELSGSSTVLTHCHSSSVVSILKRVDELGNGISVICTETRPKLQGLITAKQLSSAGVKVTLIVDSAVSHFIKDVDAVLVGADAITSRGDLVNKIGTAGIAVIAHENGVSMYSAAETFKFDPLTLWGGIEKIEERKPEEVTNPKKLKGVEIRNPAFDVTPARYLTAYITEMGVIPPQSLLNVMLKGGIEKLY